MGLKDRIEKIERELVALPKGRRRLLLSWEAARAGVPLDAEASFEALQSRIASFESGEAGRFSAELETDLEAVGGLRG